MNRKDALKSYEEGWKRSRAFWREENARQATADAERWERERAIVAAERKRAEKILGAV